MFRSFIKGAELATHDVTDMCTHRTGIFFILPFKRLLVQHIIHPVKQNATTLEKKEPSRIKSKPKIKVALHSLYVLLDVSANHLFIHVL